MVRTAIPVQVMGAYSAGDDTITWTAGDAANDHEFDNKGGRCLLLMKNENVAAKPATVDSVACPGSYNRVSDVAMSGAGKGATVANIGVYGPFPSPFFEQGEGKVYVDIADATDVAFAVVQIPDVRS